jgi:hypothetical protein
MSNFSFPQASKKEKHRLGETIHNLIGVVHEEADFGELKTFVSMLKVFVT